MRRGNVFARGIVQHALAASGDFPYLEFQGIMKTEISKTSRVSPPLSRLSALMMAALLWSTSFPAIQWGLGEWSPLTFAFWRFVLASLALPFLAWKVEFKPSVWKAVGIWILAFLNALGYALQFLGQQYTFASRTALLINLYVLWIPLLQRIWFHRPITSHQIVSVILALSGLWALSTPFTPRLLWGDLLILGASWVWALYILLLKRELQRWKPLEINGGVFVGSALFLAPLALWEGGAIPPWTGTGMGVAVYLAIACTWLAYFLYTWGLVATTPFLSSLVLLLEVVFAWILSLILLGEPWQFLHLVGAGLLGISLIIALTDPKGG